MVSLYVSSVCSVLLIAAAVNYSKGQQQFSAPRFCKDFLTNYPTCSWIQNVDAKMSNDHYQQHNTYGEMVAYGKCVLKYLNIRFYATHTSRDSHWQFKPVKDSEDLYKFDFLSEPPVNWNNIDDGKTVDVQVDYSYIRRIEEDDNSQHMATYSVNIQHMWDFWTDDRLDWSNESACFKRNFLSLWADDITNLSLWRLKLRSMSSAKDMDVKYWRLSVNGSTGKVQGGMELTNQMNCQYNYTNYPFDSIVCLATIFASIPWAKLNKETPAQLKFDSQKYLEYIQTPPEWKVVNLTMENQKTMRKKNATTGLWDITFPPQISYKIELKRNSQLAFKIVAIMLATSVTVGMFGPLTGNANGLKFTKLLSIATSIAALMTLALHNPKIYHSTVTPQIVVAFEFTLAVTILSLLLFLTHNYLMSTVMSNLPPHYLVKRFSNAVSLGLFWIPKLSTADIDNDKSEIVGNCEIESVKDYTNEWLSINDSIHRFLFVIFFLIYFIGTFSLTRLQ